MYQCDSYSTSEQVRCCYPEGHSGEHFYSRHDETDRIRWKLAADQRDTLAARVAELEAQLEQVTALAGEWRSACEGIPNASPSVLRYAIREAREIIHKSGLAKDALRAEVDLAAEWRDIQRNAADAAIACADAAIARAEADAAHAAEATTMLDEWRMRAGIAEQVSLAVDQLGRDLCVAARNDGAPGLTIIRHVLDDRDRCCRLATARAEAAERERDLLDYTDAAKVRIEHNTAEQIAAWLEGVAADGDRMGDDKNRDAAGWLRAAADDIRAGAWRKKAGE